MAGVEEVVWLIHKWPLKEVMAGGLEKVVWLIHQWPLREKVIAGREEVIELKEVGLYVEVCCFEKSL